MTECCPYPRVLCSVPRFLGRKVSTVKISSNLKTTELGCEILVGLKADQGFECTPSTSKLYSLKGLMLLTNAIPYSSLFYPSSQPLFTGKTHSSMGCPNNSPWANSGALETLRWPAGYTTGSSPRLNRYLLYWPTPTSVCRRSF